MCKFIGKSNERILCKLRKSEILRLYSIVHVAMETMKTSHFTCQSKSFISIFFTCQVSACELQPFSCHDLANDIYSQTAKTLFSHLKQKSSTLFNRIHKLATRHRKIGYYNIISYGKFYEIDIAWYYPSNRMTKDKIMKTNDSDAFRTFENFFGETEMI